LLTPRPILFAGLVSIALATSAAAAPANEQASAPQWVVRPEWVRAHESFLASDALQGRGSATRDEAIAAAYVASQFEGYGLKPAPGMTGYLQTATVIRSQLKAPPSLTVNNVVVPATLLLGPRESIRGKLTVFASDRASDMPAADIVVATSPKVSTNSLVDAARAKHVRFLIIGESAHSRQSDGAIGGSTSMPIYLEGTPSGQDLAVATVSPEIIGRLAKQTGADMMLDMSIIEKKSPTTNAIGYLQGTDPQAGVLLFTAHLDHLGVRADGTIMHGANDDASGTTAVLELAHAMAAGKAPRRSLLFVCYGSEELGLYGSRYFAAHPPVPLASIVANIEFEMIGAQDPKLPQGVMMMTGFERSNLGEALKQHGALVTGDPYPEQHFFERSDNYQLALAGIVAHTVSGWAVTPTYHQPTDTLESLNLPFMTRAIQSLIEPVRWLADGDFQPRWNAGGKPSE
jgi:aminopeptidase YwaD